MIRVNSSKFPPFFSPQNLVRQNESEIMQLREIINEKDEESRKNLTILDAKLQELEHLKKNIGNMGTVSACLVKHSMIKSAGYYVIPSIQKIAFERPSICMSVRKRIIFTLCWEHFLTNFLQTCYDIGKECPGILDG